MTHHHIKLALSGLFLIAGLCLIAYNNWQVTIGVFLIIWAHKLECH